MVVCDVHTEVSGFGAVCKCWSSLWLLGFHMGLCLSCQLKSYIKDWLGDRLIEQLIRETQLNLKSDWMLHFQSFKRLRIYNQVNSGLEIGLKKWWFYESGCLPRMLHPTLGTLPMLRPLQPSLSESSWGLKDLSWDYGHILWDVCSNSSSLQRRLKKSIESFS